MRLVPVSLQSGIGFDNRMEFHELFSSVFLTPSDSRSAEEHSMLSNLCLSTLSGKNKDVDMQMQLQKFMRRDVKMGQT
jgi:hypothetical protein